MTVGFYIGMGFDSSQYSPLQMLIYILTSYDDDLIAANCLDGLTGVQRDIYAESKGFTRRERKGSCRAVDLPQVSDEVGEELLEAVRLVEGAQRQ